MRGRIWRAAVLCAALALPLSLPQGAAQKSPITIYVGPQVRDGFVDVDQGVIDSIRDIKSVMRKRIPLRIVDEPGDALLRLYVIRRGRVGSSGMVGLPVGNMLLFAPIRTLAVDTLLRVGDYERPIVGTEDQWKDCAGQVVNSLKVWLSQNISKFEESEKSPK